MIQELRCLFERDLAVLAREVALYPTDESLWVQAPGVANSGGNLALHLVGNLRHFIGAQLGSTGYIRHRDLEFSTRTGSRSALLEAIQTTACEVQAALAALDPARLAEPFPLAVGPAHPQTGVFLLHLVAHLGFHLGQIDYHRRLTTGEATSADPLSPAGLVLKAVP